jgi:hypothetical protein
MPSLEDRQEQMRQKAKLLDSPDLTVPEIAAMHKMSTSWAYDTFKNEPGVLPLGPRSLRVPVSVHNRVMNRLTLK